MKNVTIVFLILLPVIFFLTWCDTNRNFMDVDNKNAKNDFKDLVWDWKLLDSKTKIEIPNNLSWTIETAKEYANKYYEDSLHWYVDTAKEWLSWATQKLKWYYNNWVDELNGRITDGINWAISWELNKLKLK